jgi:hypothetical protein
MMTTIFLILCQARRLSPRPPKSSRGTSPYLMQNGGIGVKIKSVLDQSYCKWVNLEFYFELHDLIDQVQNKLEAVENIRYLKVHTCLWCVCYSI